MTAAGLPLRGEDSPVCYAVGRVLRRMEYLVVDSALGTGLLAGKSNERPIAVLDDFLSAAELQPLLAQLPDNPNEYLHAAMRDGTAKSNDGKGIALQVDVEAAVMRKLRAAMFAGADTELTTAEQTRLPVLISAGDCAEHRDRFVSDSDGYSPDKLVYGYAAFVYLAGGEDSTLFFRHDSGKVESVACAPGRMVVFKNLAVRHWVEGPMEQARVMLGPFAMEPREGEIRQITAGSAPGWMFLAIAAILLLAFSVSFVCCPWSRPFFGVVHDTVSHAASRAYMKRWRRMGRLAQRCDTPPDTDDGGKDVDLFLRCGTVAFDHWVIPMVILLQL